ncbi:outer membrane protein [Shimia biformata]|uniref:outer membrane protein n=1 Tax=Shimia biformata TaxID=1294299 RepID=UPI00194E5F94|nr:outer membrane beta-barrel protein [Shimia biformata]
MKKLLGATAFGALAIAGPAAAEFEIAIYGGYQTSPHSTFTGDVAGTPYDGTFAWDGKSFTLPPYYGVRGTYWRNDAWGFGLELTHAKAYASEADLAEGDFDRFEFTDGHNIITLNLHRRWKGLWMDGRMTPYVMGGIGIAMPHVDIQPTYAGAPHTYGYQVTGPAAKLGAGVSYAINDRFSVFGEYQFSYTDNEVSLDGGGTLSGPIITNALNIGLSMAF